MAERLNGMTVTRAATLQVTGDTIFSPPAAIDSITAAGGLTQTNTYHRIVGSGGAVTVTANPAITAGQAGQYLIIEGTSNSNTVTFNTGNGLHLHGSFTIADEDILVLIYDADGAAWDEVSRNASASEKAWTFDSPAAANGTFYFGGYYEFGGSANDFDPSINFGTANSSYAAHLMIVTGAQAADEITITVTGTSITDAGVRNATPDTQTITIPNGTAASTFYETSKKWIGQIAIETTGGTAISCDYGWAKYWDNNNTNFRLVGIEATWLAGANDNTPNISLLHHKATGWTYGAGGTPTLPAAVANMNTDHNTEIKAVNGENGAWKRANLTATVEGSASEGTIIQVYTTANKTFELGNVLLRVRPD